MRWTDITVKQFQELSRIEKAGGADIDVKLAKVAYLEGKTLDDLDALNVGQLQELMKKYAALFGDVHDGDLMTHWDHNGIRYKLISDIRDINAGQYNELVHFSQGGDIIPNLHFLLASLVKPMHRRWFRWVEAKRPHQEVAEAFLHAPFPMALKSAVFFCKLYTAFLRNMKTSFLQYLKEMGKTSWQAEREYMALLSILDGFTTQKV